MALLSSEEANRMAKMQLAIVMRFDLISFLEIAWRFPLLSLENICLIMLQNPSATAVQTESEWRTCCYQVKHNETPLTLLTASSEAVYVYDISQTDGKQTAIVPNAEQAYTAMIKTIGKEPLVLENTKSRVAYYDETDHTWCVSAKANNNARFQSILTYWINDILKGAKDQNFNAMASNDMAVYMICKKYGISVQGINLTGLQTSLAKEEDDSIRQRTIYCAMNCFESDIMKDLHAYYSDRLMERKLEKDQQKEKLEKEKAERIAAEEARIQMLAEQIAQEKINQSLCS